ncbi:MAG TPA: tetratricopeptide repeat protein, partial [Pyrinomonadaceae bacterium]|nr:tetratricopeptide repeat protein [Pyrinomonadaceae bacterium]
MSAKQFMNLLTETLDFGDRLMNSGRNAEAIQVFERIVSDFRRLESAQQETHDGGPAQIPLSLRMIVLHRDISVPLHRLGTVHLKVGDYDSALEYFREGES